MMESVPMNVKYEYNANLGSRDVLACERGVLEINISNGRVVLEPDGLPTIRPAGNGAIAVRTSHMHVTTWNPIQAVTETFLAARFDPNQGHHWWSSYSVACEETSEAALRKEFSSLISEAL